MYHIKVSKMNTKLGVAHTQWQQRASYLLYNKSLYMKKEKIRSLITWIKVIA